MNMKLILSSFVAFQSSLDFCGRLGILKTNRHDVVKTTSTRHCARLMASSSNKLNEKFDEEEAEEEFLRRELAHLESLEEVLKELEGYGIGEEDDGDDEQIVDEWDEDSLKEFLESLSAEGTDEMMTVRNSSVALEILENALLQGVVPVSAGVGSDGLPGDFGFDPFGFADRDMFQPTQQFLLNLLPESRWEEEKFVDNSIPKTKTSLEKSYPRPKALVLRDYREAEIRHGRLAMLAAMFWPLQEMLDKLILDEDQYGPLIYGPVTLPYFPLVMTAIMLLLGYLDIYSQAIKDMDQIGEAFLPGDCFWDPLQILQGAPDSMKRNMQERELFNGRAAMLAVAAYTVEEAFTRKALIDIDNNALLLQPAYQIPYIQKWLDSQFSVTNPESMFITPSDLGLLDALP